MNKAEEAKAKMAAMLKAATLKQLELAWKASDACDFKQGAILREAVGKELERRFPEKFDEWLWDDESDFSIFA